MRPRCTLSVVAAMAVTALSPPLWLDSATAAASGCPVGTIPTSLPSGTICVPAADPGDQGSGESDAVATSDSDESGGPACTRAGVEIACVTDEGVWMASQQCYAAQVEVPAGSPIWQGNDPGEGSVWSCTNTPFTAGFFFFVANGAGPAPVLPDPGELAQRALDQMVLTSPDVRTAPASPDMSYVGLETWLWMPDPQWNPLSLTVTAGSTSVTATARPTTATWDLTAGVTTCTSAGRAWIPGMSDAESTDCSFTFDVVSDGQPADAFPVTAVLTYDVDWTCSGACTSGAGSLGEVDGPVGVGALRVGERQSVVVGGT